MPFVMHGGTRQPGPADARAGDPKAGWPAGQLGRRSGGRAGGRAGPAEHPFIHACTCTFIYAFIHLPIPPAIHRLCRSHNSHCFRYCQNKPTVRSADWERGRQALRAEGGWGGPWRGKGTAVVIRATLVVKHGFFPGLHPFVYPGFIPSAGGRASAGRAGGSGGWTGRLGGRIGRAGRAGVSKEVKIGILAGNHFPRLILSRAGLTPARDKINPAKRGLCRSTLNLFSDGGR